MVILAIILGLLPGFAWLVFYLKEDLHPEPKEIIFFVFLAGAFSAILALLAEYKAIDFFKLISLERYSIGGLLVFAFIEEICKFGVVYFIVKKSKYFDEPVDAMIYIVVAALGFATLENIAVVSNIISKVTIIPFGDLLNAIPMRFIGATLLHTLASGILGYYWAMSIGEFGRKKILVLGILLATLVHAVFNYLVVLNNENNGGIIYTAPFLIVIGLLIIGDFEKLKKRPL